MKLTAASPLKIGLLQWKFIDFKHWFSGEYSLLVSGRVYQSTSISKPSKYSSMLRWFWHRNPWNFFQIRLAYSYSKLGEYIPFLSTPPPPPPKQEKNMLDTFKKFNKWTVFGTTLKIQLPSFLEGPSLFSVPVFMISGLLHIWTITMAAPWEMKRWDEMIVYIYIIYIYQQIFRVLVIGGIGSI